MDIGTVLHAMRDPAGIPSHPVIFQVLMIVTWIFHIAFVHMTLGTAAFAIYAFYKRAPGTHWEQLSMAMTKAAKVGVSLLIVLGVAPLLFTQVSCGASWPSSTRCWWHGISSAIRSSRCSARAAALEGRCSPPETATTRSGRVIFAFIGLQPNNGCECY